MKNNIKRRTDVLEAMIDSYLESIDGEDEYYRIANLLDIKGVHFNTLLKEAVQELDSYIISTDIDTFGQGQVSKALYNLYNTVHIYIETNVK